MRSFSIITASLVLALTASAASIGKRAISPGVQTCINDISAAGAQLTLVKADVDAFTSAAGYSGALAIHNKEQALETLLKTAGTSCCAQTTTVSNEEAEAVIGVVSTLVPEIEGALSSIVTKKPEFDAIFLATALVKGDIKNLDSQTKALDTCLVAATPADYLDAANGYVTRIDNAFATAKTAYGI